MTADQRRRLIRFTILAGTILVLWFLYFLRSVLWPFVFAFFIAYIFDPWIEYLDRKGIPRTLAIALVLVGFALILTLTLVLIVPQISREVSEAARKFPQYYEVAQSRLLPWMKDFKADHPELVTQIQEYIDTNVRPKLPLLLSPVVGFLKHTFSGIVTFLIVTMNLLLVPVLAFYLLKDFPSLKDRCIAMIPPRYCEGFKSRVAEVDEALSQFLRGQLIVSLFLAFIYTTGLLILGVPLAFPIGIFSGLANMVPYLGFVLGISASLLLSFLDNQDWHRLIWVVVLYTFAQMMEGLVISPLVVGKRTGLHPVVIMLALVIGGTLFGFMGMLLAVPFMAVATVFIKSGYETYLKSTWYKEKHVTAPVIVAPDVITIQEPPKQE